MTRTQEPETDWGDYEPATVRPALRPGFEFAHDTRAGHEPLPGEMPDRVFVAVKITTGGTVDDLLRNIARLQSYAARGAEQLGTVMTRGFVSISNLRVAVEAFYKAK